MVNEGTLLEDLQKNFSDVNAKLNRQKKLQDKKK